MSSIIAYSLLMLPLSYLIGSIPFAYIIGKTVKGIDIRNYGSGNPGATNVFRNVGKSYGLLTLLLDLLKGLLPVLLSRNFYADNTMPLLCGFAAIAGHTWPVFLKFRGGKGVATGAGAALAVMPGATLCGFVVFLLVFSASGYISLGSITGVTAFVISCWLMKYNTAFCLLVSLLGALIIYRHRSNIKRLIDGTETKTNILKKG